ncbi:MAG: DUF2630 family protein [Actinomycetota bacterium]|nr:DUF2630 family protein [Actinomycetota bacterium]
MDDDLHDRIAALAHEEHALHQAHAEGDGLSDLERLRLRQIEVELDRVWDLLRQREALRDAGLDPAAAAERDAATVEGYLS